MTHFFPNGRPGTASHVGKDTLMAFQCSVLPNSIIQGVQFHVHDAGPRVERIPMEVHEAEVQEAKETRSSCQ